MVRNGRECRIETHTNPIEEANSKFEKTGPRERQTINLMPRSGAFTDHDSYINSAVNNSIKILIGDKSAFTNFKYTGKDYDKLNY